MPVETVVTLTIYVYLQGIGGLVSETRREYVHVGSGPASLLATVSETRPPIPCVHRVLSESNRDLGFSRHDQN
jgi:hypothetical protein